METQLNEKALIELKEEESEFGIALGSSSSAVGGEVKNEALDKLKALKVSLRHAT